MASAQTGVHILTLDEVEVHQGLVQGERFIRWCEQVSTSQSRVTTRSRQDHASLPSFKSLWLDWRQFRWGRGSRDCFFFILFKPNLVFYNESRLLRQYAKYV